METKVFGEAQRERLQTVIHKLKQLTDKHDGGFDSILSADIGLSIAFTPAGAIEMDDPKLAGELSDIVDSLYVGVTEYLGPTSKVINYYQIYLLSEEVAPEYVKVDMRDYHDDKVDPWFRAHLASPEARSFVDKGNWIYSGFGGGDTMIRPDFLEACGAPEEIINLQEKLVERARQDTERPGFSVMDLEKLEMCLNTLEY